MYSSRNLPSQTSSYQNLPPPPPNLSQYGHSQFGNSQYTQVEQSQVQNFKIAQEKQKFNRNISNLSDKIIYRLQLSASFSGLFLFLLLGVVIVILLWDKENANPDQVKTGTIAASVCVGVLSLLVVVICTVATCPLFKKAYPNSRCFKSESVPVLPQIRMPIQAQTGDNQIRQNFGQNYRQNHSQNQFNQNLQDHPNYSAQHRLPEWNGIQIPQNNTGTYAESITGTEMSWLPNMKSLVKGDIKPEQEQPDRAKLEDAVLKAKNEYMAEIMKSSVVNFAGDRNYAVIK